MESSGGLDQRESVKNQVVSKLGHYENSYCSLKRDTLEFYAPAIPSGGVTCSALLPFLFKGFKSSLPRLIRWAAS
jgi:hypothetical protein